jgi:3'(2'), 5'-bisphosphate nucleotidase
MTEHSETDVELARRVAVEAGELLVRVRDDAALPADATREERRALGDEGDLHSNRLILDRLLAARPDDAVLSEESDDDLGRLDADRVWIVDPLDGTAEYRTERDEFAVHIALWERRGGEGVLSASCIALPVRERVWSTDDAAGDLPALDLDGTISLVVSRSHIPNALDSIVERLTEELRSAGHPSATVVLAQVGSVGAKVDEVLLGRSAAYVFSGGLSEWDAAAPFAVAVYRGFVVEQVDSSGFEYNRRSPIVGSGYVSHPALADALRAAVAGSGL